MNKKEIPQFKTKHGKILLENANAQRYDGKTVLMITMFQAPAIRDLMIPILLDNKVDVNIQDNRKNTALIFASQRGLTNIVKELITYGADVNIKGDNEKTALLYASREGHTDLVKLLLENGADQNIKDDCGNTPLSIAKSYKHDKIIKLLLDNDVVRNTNENQLNSTSTSNFAKITGKNTFVSP